MSLFSAQARPVAARVAGIPSRIAHPVKISSARQHNLLTSSRPLPSSSTVTDSLATAGIAPPVTMASSAVAAVTVKFSPITETASAKTETQAKRPVTVFAPLTDAGRASAATRISERRARVARDAKRSIVSQLSKLTMRPSAAPSASDKFKIGGPRRHIPLYTCDYRQSNGRTGNLYLAQFIKLSLSVQESVTRIPTPTGTPSPLSLYAVRELEEFIPSIKKFNRDWRRGKTSYCPRRPCTYERGTTCLKTLDRFGYTSIWSGRPCSCCPIQDLDCFSIRPKEWVTTPAEADVIPDRARRVAFREEVVTATHSFEKWWADAWGGYPENSSDPADRYDDEHGFKNDLDLELLTLANSAANADPRVPDLPEKSAPALAATPDLPATLAPVAAPANDQPDTTVTTSYFDAQGRSEIGRLIDDLFGSDDDSWAHDPDTS